VLNEKPLWLKEWDTHQTPKIDHFCPIIATKRHL